MLRRYGTTLIGGDAAKGNLVSNAAITGGLSAHSSTQNGGDI